MKLSEWISLLEPIEQGYVRQCFHFWQGTNGGVEPSVPLGLSKSRAEVLKYHCRSLNNGQTGKRKVEESKPVSFRWTDKFKKDLAFEAAELDITLSEYVLRCVNIGRPVVMAYPKISKQFDGPEIRS